MRPAPVLVALLLATLAGCGALGGGGGPGDAEPSPTLTPVAVPATESTPTIEPTAVRSAPIVLNNARTREYAVILSVIDGPVRVVEVYYRNGETAVVDYAADPSSIDARLAERSVVGVRAPNRTDVARYQVAANASGTHRPFPALDRAGAGTSLLWVVVPVAEAGVPTDVVDAGVDACAPPHSLVTKFRVRVDIGTDRVRVDCA